MSKTTRRSFLKAGAAIGSFVGLNSIGLKAKAEETSSLLSDPYFPETPPKINNGPVFSRRASMRSRPTGKIPILQGATSKTQTQFRILIKANVAYTYSILDAAGTRRSVSPRGRAGVAASQSLIDHVYVDGLRAGAQYILEIAAPGDPAERRFFATMSEASAQGDPLRVALISCQNDRYVDDQSDMWAAVAKSAPELMIFNGDSCYVDQRASGTVDGMWDRHLTTRRMLDVFKWDHLVPVITTWDDHDVGENDANGSSPYIGPARDFFMTMFGSDPVDGYSKSAGMSYYFDTNGLRFVMLDDRSNKTSDQIFSSEDEKWIERAILSSPGPVCLVNGIQFWGGYLAGAESIEATSVDQLWRIMKIGQKATVPIVLMSGDVHFSELMELEKELLGYRSYEFCSSAIHSRTLPGQQFRSYNGRRLESTSHYNFMALEMRVANQKKLEFEVVCLGADDHEFFRLKSDVQR